MTEDKQPFAMMFWKPCDEFGEPGGNLTDCPPWPRWASHKHVAIKRVALFHYILKSREDFEIKSARGGGVRGSGKPMSYWEKFTACASFPVLQQLCSCFQRPLCACFLRRLRSCFQRQLSSCFQRRSAAASRCRIGGVHCICACCNTVQMCQGPFGVCAL